MDLESKITKVAENIIKQNQKIQAFLVFDQDGFLIYSSLQKKSHGELFGALTKDIFEKIKPLGNTLGVSNINALHLTMNDYIFHVFKIKELYVLLLKIRA